MKKILYGTTALVAAGFISSAACAAEPIKLSVGGHMWQFFGYVDQESDLPTTKRNNFGHHSDTEVYFTGSTKLDNGLTVKAVIELEAERTSAVNAGASNLPNRNADQQYLEISGKFGMLSMGERFNLGHRVHNNAPQFGIDWTNLHNGFIANDLTGTNSYTSSVVSGPVEFMTSTNAILNRSGSELSYVTPAFYGFNVGVSYTPNANGRGIANENAAIHDALVAAVAYKGTIYGATVGADVGLVRADRAKNTQGGQLRGLQTGLKVGYNGFTVGGSYLRVRDDIDGAVGNTTQTANNDGHAFDVGAAYENGPYGVSLTYFSSTWEGRTEATPTGASSGSDKIKNWSLGGKYLLGPGVTLDAALVHSSLKDESGVDANSTSGWGLVSGVRLAF